MAVRTQQPLEGAPPSPTADDRRVTSALAEHQPEPGCGVGGARFRTRAVFGTGVLASAPPTVAKIVTERGLTPEAFVLLGRSSHGKPWRQSLLAGLGDLDPEPYNHPPGGPTPASVAAAVAAARASGAGVLVGAGGGGVMDAAKAVAAQLRAERGEARDPALVTVPTTPGSGAEVTPFATIWDRENDRKLSVSAHAEADVAFVDPDLCAGLPAADLAASALDALCQGAEAAWSTRSDDSSIAAGLTAVALMAAAAEDLLRGAVAERSRVLACLAGLYGGRAIAISQTTSCHALSYPLTLRHRLRHGHACGLTLAPLLEYNALTPPSECADPRGADHVRAVTARIVRLLGGRAGAEAARTIDRIRALGGLAAFADVDVDVQALVGAALTYGRAANNPRRLDRERLCSLLAPLATSRQDRPC